MTHMRSLLIRSLLGAALLSVKLTTSPPSDVSDRHTVQCYCADMLIVWRLPSSYFSWLARLQALRDPYCL